MTNQNSAVITFLRRTFAWYDARQHFWVLERTRPSWYRFIHVIATIAVVPVGLLALLTGIQTFSAQAAAALGVLATLWFGVRYLLYLPLALLGKKTRRAVFNVGFNMRPALATAVLGGCTFLIISPALFVRPGLGTPGEAYGVMQWAAFFANKALNIVLLDLPSTAAWFKTPIEPHTLPAHTALAVWGLLFTLGAVETVLLVFKRNLGKQSFYGTVSDCWETCAVDPDEKLMVGHQALVAPLAVVHQASIQSIGMGLLLDEVKNTAADRPLRKRRDMEEV